MSDHAQAWRDGHADGLEGRRDEARYSRDDDEARCYRDGHRMGRREVADGTAPAAEPVIEIHPPENPRIEMEGASAIPRHERAADRAAPAPSSDPRGRPPAEDGGDIPEDNQLPFSAAHPSAFSDPTPGRKAKRSKPVDPDQASLF